MSNDGTVTARIALHTIGAPDSEASFVRFFLRMCGCKMLFLVSSVDHVAGAVGVK